MSAGMFAEPFNNLSIQLLIGLKNKAKVKKIKKTTFNLLKHFRHSVYLVDALKLLSYHSYRK